MLFRLMSILLLLGALTTPPSLFAQRNCNTMEMLEQEIQEDPKRLIKLEQIEAHTLRSLQHAQPRNTGIITIPVVVHVVYNNSTENISDAQVQSQIDILNEDFRRMNANADNVWPQAADAEIEFCLAAVDPDGNPTNGITRTQTNVTSFSSSGNPVKFDGSGGKSAWPSSSYLNFWVCDLSGGLLGYAQFPGGSSATDGIVCDYQYVGNIGTATPPFDLGRTATHEVGHWLNLRHVWGDGPCSVDDFVADTPLSDAANFGCALGHVSCGTVDMVQNYMDYSDDACMNIFTAGQRDRMRALFDPGGFRESILDANVCFSTPPPTCDDGIQNGNETGVDCGGPDCASCPCDGNRVTVQLTFDNDPDETSWTIVDENSNVVAAGGPYPDAADGSTLSVEVCLPDGCYDFIIEDSFGDGICCSNGNGSYLVTHEDGTVYASGGSFDFSEKTTFCIGVPPPDTCNDGIQNGDEEGVDCGGANCPPCDDCDYSTINSESFENSLGLWIDGGSDCERHFDPDYANTGNYSLRLRDNSASSIATTGSLNLSAYNKIRISFSYLARSMDNNESFLLQVSNNGFIYSTVKEWTLGVDFENDVRKLGYAILTTNLSSTTRFRFRCDGSSNTDWIYIDDVVIAGCSDVVVLPTCDDGIQNGNETDVDCGGPDCPACPTCDDGIQNGNETGVDCGGPDCPACPTCFDGIQNGNETGVDCGGPDCIPCSTGGPCTDVNLSTDGFESDFGFWIDGGDDCERYLDASYANSGNYSARIRDNSFSSVLRTDALNLSAYEELSLSFSYLPRSMDNNEGFSIQISTSGSFFFQTLKQYRVGTDFENDVRYFETITINPPFSNNTVIRFVGEGSSNTDWIYLDDVVLDGCVSSSRINLSETGGAGLQLSLAPNPTKDLLNVDLTLIQASEQVNVIVFNSAGQVVRRQEIGHAVGQQRIPLDMSGETPGIYLLQVITDHEQVSRKFVVIP